ncbi:MAG: hypothetical protein HKM06_07080, partial [Spirochaetales bacterium]|nr:hypothetical protein [Spirochaetales bacterium]
AYAVGYIQGTGTYSFGNGVTATGTYTYSNTVIVKYNGSGAAQWAQTVSAGTNGSGFAGVTVDGSGNAYAVGFIFGTGTYGFGNGVTATGAAPSYNTVIVKYNASGAAQWAQTLTSGTSYAQFSGVTVDTSGNAYAVGYIHGTVTYGFGNGVAATGTSTNYNTVIVKYNGSGTAQWARTLTGGTSNAQFNGVTVDASGNTYAVGYIQGSGTYGLGNGVTATGPSTGYNTVIVKYNASGAAQWAQTLTGGTGDSNFYGVTVDTSGNTYAVGYIQGFGTYGFGNSVTATGTSLTGYNTVIVKYLAH